MTLTSVFHSFFLVWVINFFSMLYFFVLLSCVLAWNNWFVALHLVSIYFSSSYMQSILRPLCFFLIFFLQSLLSPPKVYRT
jgi:hypothetical protein